MWRTMLEQIAGAQCTCVIPSVDASSISRDETESDTLITKSITIEVAIKSL